MRTSGRLPALAFGVATGLLLVGFGTAWAEATVVIVNLDGPGEGLNDAAPFTPQGGNLATTFGEARLRCVEMAAALWANSLVTPVNIRVGVSFDPLGGTSNSATLGLGGPDSFHRDFTGAPRPATWYPSALADRWYGDDLDPVGMDIEVIFNLDVDGDQVMGTTHFYYGLDANPPSEDIDFVTVAVHEMAHGLGFMTPLDEFTGERLLGYDDHFMVHLEHHGATPSDFPAMTDAQRQAAIIAGADLHWTGPAATAAATMLSGGVSPEGHIEMYGPNPAQTQLSLVHFSDSLTPDQLMEPFYATFQLDLDLTLALLEDVGWGGGPQCSSVTLP